jgi:lauroyl/myristoyl acyltransferase
MPAPAPLEERLAELDLPQAHRLTVTGEGLGGRIHALPALHRAVPLPAAVALAGARGRAEWRLLPGRRADALDRARVLAPPGAPDAVVRALARAHLRERCVQTELSWRPWDARRMPVEGLDGLREALAGGRGAILATLHAGPWLNLVHALQARGLRVNLSGGRRLWEPPLEGHEGRWIRTQNVWVEEAGARWVRKPGSFEVLRELLRRGELCWMNWDVRGTTPAVFLGRPVTPASGIARLALELGTPVVPALVLRRGLGQVATLGAPLLPAAGDDAGTFTARIGEELSAGFGPHRAQAHVALVRWMVGDR